VPVTITLVSSDPKRFRVAQDSRPITVPPSPPSTRTSTFFLTGHEFNADLSLSPRLQEFGIGYAWPARSDVLSKTAVSTKVTHERTDSYDTKYATGLIEYTRNLLGIPVLGHERVGSGYLQVQGRSILLGKKTAGRFC